jgi:hypothetical protein
MSSAAEELILGKDEHIPIETPASLPSRVGDQNENPVIKRQMAMNGNVNRRRFLIAHGSTQLNAKLNQPTSVQTYRS